MDYSTFLTKIAQPNATGCMEWTGSCNSSGYGTVNIHGVTYTAHRVMAWLAKIVPSPAAPKDRKGGGFILHTCDNRRCCNYDHFKLGTYSQNQREAYARKRKVQPKGHEHVNSKLMKEQVDEIRAALSTRQVDLATQYGVSQVSISKVIRKETYV